MRGRSVPLILLVDGSPDCRRIFETILTATGFQTAEAATAAQGLVMAEQLRPDLIVSEYPLRVAPYGSLCQAIRSSPLLCETLVLCVTAHAFADTRVQAYQAGVDLLLTKPIHPRSLCDTVQQLLRTRLSGKAPFSR